LQFGPADPGTFQRIAVYGLCIVDDEILLVRASERTEVPGRWFLPGGGVDHGEHPEVALARELTEETGLTGRINRFAGVLSDVRTRSDGVLHHTVRLIYEIVDLDGELVSEAAGSSDLARWVSISAARSYPTAHYVREACSLVGIDLQAVK
jgi:ADP-ribose pyrophosphatase YjhB (NUDIX family)